MNLCELTGQESGIIVFGNGEIIVDNWMTANDDQIPMLSPFGGDTVNFPIADGAVEAAAATAREVDDIRDEIPNGGTVIYDYNDDIAALLDSVEPVPGTVYDVAGRKIIAPEGWI